MSLKTFHIFFISVSALLLLFFAAWGLQQFRSTGNQMSLILGGFSAILLLPLGLYGAWFLRKIRKLPPAAIAAFLAAAGTTLLKSHRAFACAVCFGDPNSLMTKGANWGILTLAIVIVMILVGIAAIAVIWGRRDRSLERSP